VDCDKVILIAPESSLIRTLSGVNVDMVNPEASKSLAAAAILPMIYFKALPSRLSIIYYYLILS
jgi:hypothetical protein